MCTASARSVPDFRPCALCAAWLIASAAAWGQGPESPAISSTAPAPPSAATAPASAPVAATAPAATGDSNGRASAQGVMGAILESLKLTDAQADSYRQALTARHKDRVDDGATFTVFLRKVAGLPKLQAADWNELDRPAYGNLVARPEHYAGWPMSIRVFPNRVKKWTPGVDFRASGDWTVYHGPIYSYECLWADPDIQLDQPLIVLYPLEPTAVLGKPSKVEGNVWIYDNLRTVEVAGVFYKLYTDKEANTSRLRDYPVVLAWQVQPADWRGIRAGSETWAQALGVAIFLFVGIAAYFFWRVRAAARRVRTGGPQRPRYVRREIEDEKEEADPEEDQADPGLAAAAEEFRKQDKAKDS